MSEKQLTQLISAERIAEIDHWIAKFPPDQKQSASLQALRIVQDEKQWLSEELICAVADYLDMPKIAAFEVATFYSMYDLKPVGKYKINICNSISCQLNGSEKLIEHVEQTLNIKVGETTQDGKFTLKKVECLGACVNAPACYIGRDYYEHLSNEKLDQILKELG
ncbi:MAG: NADH-quinone oxidoreductase subunit NuoE [Legionellales bacterium]|nr:NADH-quinone oxidoreductase subunit NuoE [Legionellales bacterium]